MARVTLLLYLKPIAAARAVPASTSSARRVCEKIIDQSKIMISASSSTPVSLLSNFSKCAQPLPEMRAWGEDEWERKEEKETEEGRRRGVDGGRWG